MKHSLTSLLLAGATLLPGVLTTPARAATMILHDFTGGASDGKFPQGSLVLHGSKLYGMADSAGSGGKGVIFSMNTDGSGYALLHNFSGGASDGALPLSSLTLSGSKLYGVTYNGGASDNGTIFSMNTDGTGFTLLHTFTRTVTDGGCPFGDLTLSGSKLYGMTKYGGSNNFGTLFSLNTDGTGYSLLRSFTGGDAALPTGNSLISVGSKIYGVSTSGGPGFGTAFSVNTDGTEFTLLHNFLQGNSDGGQPVGSLLFAGSKFYGATSTGGSSQNGGTLFSMNIDGTGFSLLHSFKGGANDGFVPHGSLTLSGAKLYGMTEFGGTIGATGSGTLFSINTDGSGFSVLERFGVVSGDGANPQYTNLTASADGSALYAMTAKGGSAGFGVVFSRAIPEPGAFALLGFGTLLLSARRRNARA